MQKINNLKLNKSYKQKKDYTVALNSKKRVHLQNTDWTQLDDVAIDNIDAVNEWRQRLRDFKICDNADTGVEAELDKIIESKPIIKHSSSKPDNNILENQIEVMSQKVQELENKLNSQEVPTCSDVRDELMWLNRDEALEKMNYEFPEYKNKVLLRNGILEYSLTKLLLEEAVDKKVRNSNDANFSLLDEDTENLDDIIQECKVYFRQINKTYRGLKKEESSMYNMDTEEINNWFIDNGYRYRCKE